MNSTDVDSPHVNGPKHGYDTISFLSDYGLEDEIVGVVHSVIAGIAPSVRVIDITHGITPHNVRAGGLTLARIASYLSPGVVLAVVNPEAGTSHRAVAIEVGDGTSVLIGLDNGLLSPAVALVGGATRAVELADKDYWLPVQSHMGSLFYGRDVLGPAAAHLCTGVPLSYLGPAIDSASLVPGLLPVSFTDGEDLVAEVLWIDQFGNSHLNLSTDDIVNLGKVVHVGAGTNSCIAERSTDYDAIGVGRIGLIIDSWGLVALTASRRSAADELGLHEGSEVRLRTLTETLTEDSASFPGRTATSVTLSHRPKHGHDTDYDDQTSGRDQVQPRIDTDDAPSLG